MKKAPHPVDLYAGQKLREARQSRGLSAAKLGQLLSQPITFQQIQKYEKGINRMSLSRIYEFAEALQVPIPHFIPDLSIESEDKPIISRQEYNLIHCIRQLPSPCRNSMIALIKELRKDHGRKV